LGDGLELSKLIDVFIAANAVHHLQVKLNLLNNSYFNHYLNLINNLPHIHYSKRTVLHGYNEQFVTEQLNWSFLTWDRYNRVRLYSK
jgi:hypothetical protein